MKTLARAEDKAEILRRLQALRPDSETFRQMVENRRSRHDDWYKVPAGHVDVCNVPLPIRIAKPEEPK